MVSMTGRAGESTIAVRPVNAAARLICAGQVRATRTGTPGAGAVPNNGAVVSVAPASATESLRSGSRSARVAALGMRLVLAGIAITLALPGLTDGGFWFTDESRHATSGAFLLDLVREGLWHPIQYAEGYYARYPALAIPYYAPPFFHAVEALFFAALGVSAATARLCVLFFHVVALQLFFSLVERDLGSFSAFFSAVYFATFPLVVHWSTHVVLEPPTTCMCLFATCLLLRYEDSPGIFRALAWIGSLLAALATKQTAVFLVAAHLLYCLMRPGLFRGIVRWCALAVLAVAAMYGGFWLAFSPYQMAAIGKSWGNLPELAQHLVEYPAQLPESIGWPMLLAACLGIGAVLAGPRQPVALLFLLWGACVLAMLASLNRYVPRYSYLACPMLAFMAFLGVRHVFGARGWANGAALALLAAPNLAAAWSADRPVVNGYREAAQLVASLPGDGSVLFDGYWDGDFVFFSRESDPKRRPILRGSKVLYNFASFKWIDFESYVESEKDILALFERYGVRYVVVEDYDEFRTSAGTLLRQLLATERFRKIAEVPLSTRNVRLKATSLRVYEYVDARPAGARSIEIRLPGLRRTVSAPLGAGAQTP